MIIGISFDRYILSYGLFFECHRIYTKNHHWTPFLRVYKRGKGPKMFPHEDRG